MPDLYGSLRFPILDEKTRDIGDFFFGPMAVGLNVVGKNSRILADSSSAKFLHFASCFSLSITLAATSL